ncbi:TRAP transporter substrate-binding protein [Ramlibacter tataouinensis]|uniref:Candidate periplasmic component n=1 Tax=Ramlibacter tataouinensis (strain ATCC BAA-407 / DSM 14655 / LMG 21543 / TTB310) TaxID=365046 RepID=F5Y206_RAMTT|nr:TRAP transporter substrate-binding protein [Ramlibacter tataouinensis]AEG93590.1 Candidate periplasmic component [Ramlibacter tataouinensis TTB310]
MKTRPFLRLCAAAALAAILQPAAAQEVVLKFHHIWPTAAMAPTKVIAPWCDKIAAESKNRMRCQLLPAMSGGGTPAQLVDRVKDGVDDLTITLPGYTAGRFPAMEVFELPFMTNSAEAGAQASWDYLQKYGAKEFPGTRILAAWVHDEGYVHTASKPIKSLEDFRGLKMRAPTRQTNKLLAKLGATPVGMPVTGVADALSKGTIDGYVLPWEVIPAFKLHEMTRFHTETDPSRPALYSAGFVFAMNQAKYDSLPADLKKVIDANSGAALSRQIGKTWDDSQDAGRKAAQDRGNTFIKLSPADTDNWIKASASIHEEWVAEMDKRGLPGKQMLQEARELLAKYRK